MRCYSSVGRCFSIGDSKNHFVRLCPKIMGGGVGGGWAPAPGAHLPFLPLGNRETERCSLGNHTIVNLKRLQIIQFLFCGEMDKSNKKQSSYLVYFQ